MNPPAVLHVMSSHGGGVDRHVRDIVASVARPHLLWHVGERAQVLEVAEAPRFHPLDPARVDRDPERLAQWLRARGVGIVHLHTVVRPARERADAIARRVGVPLVVTLHDVLFLRPDAFRFDDPPPKRAWLKEVEPVLRRAKAVFAPSEFIAATARRAFAGLEIQVVPNGLAPEAHTSSAPPPARGEFLAHRPEHVVAVLGAIGPHKGADLLRALPPHLQGSGIGIVVIGYLDEQIHPGWNRRAHLYVHGPYRPEDTEALLRAYGVELVLFPNLVPESFSYALSETWAAGFPVLAGPHGAIGDRVRRHGGGWLLPEGFGAPEVAAALRRLLSPAAAAERARVKSQLATPDAERVPSLQAMAQTLDAYYRRYGLGNATPGNADPAAIQELLAASLDSSLFRNELAHLADLCDDAGQSFQHARRFEIEAREWIAKLEADMATLRAELARESAERLRLERELAGFQAAGAVAARLPRFVRRILAALFRHARS